MSTIALVGPEIEENLSLRYLASSLEAAGHSTRIIAFNAEDAFGPALQALVDDPPEVVGLSLAFQRRARDILALAFALRQAGYMGHITAGGHYATFEARNLIRDFPELDSVIGQEAEDTVLSLVDAIERRAPWDQIPGVVSRDRAGELVVAPLPRVPTLAELPWPDRRGEPARCFGHGIAPLVSSRGCYANCTLCGIAAWHEQTQPGVCYRLRDPDDVAAEMATLQRERGIDIFVFHDDNFFIPSHQKSLERVTALADAIERQGLDRFATVVKARPNDVRRDVFEVLIERLNCIRCYVGIETDSDQGLQTLRRWGKPKQNHDAITLARELDLFVCFNVLMFDPDTTLESVETNIEFMEFAPEYPFNFGRVELYAGTPLLERMKAERRVRGNYLQWDYDLHDASIERLYGLAMECFRPRNCGASALANDIQRLRFDLEIVRRLHPDRLRRQWRPAGKELSRRLSLDTTMTLRALLRHVRSGAPLSTDAELVAEQGARMRAVETEVRAQMMDFARELEAVVDRGTPLTLLGDRVATPLQDTRGLAV